VALPHAKESDKTIDRSKERTGRSDKKGENHHIHSDRRRKRRNGKSLQIFLLRLRRDLPGISPRSNGCRVKPFWAIGEKPETF
jgi:hypothetical protein